MSNAPSIVISLILLVAMLSAVEAGYRAGRVRADLRSDRYKEHVNHLQSAILGLLALLLAFTFSLALQRFDSRSEAVIDETNAIGTAFLRVDLLDPQRQPEARRTIGEYLDLRVEESLLPLSRHDKRDRLLTEAMARQDELWSIAAGASAAHPDRPSTTLFTSAINEMIDGFGRRNAALDRHVPTFVMALLFVTFLFAAHVLGFTSGLAGHRPSLLTHLFVLLLVALVFVVLDLDRPRRGVIQVSHEALVELQSQVRAHLR